MSDLSQKIEVVLFYSGEHVSLSFLEKLLGEDRSNIIKSLEELKSQLYDRGINLIENDNQYALVTSPKYSKLLEKMVSEEREGELGKASLETLTIIAYKGPISKKEIEYIRGVNCQYSLRSLLLRGLIERKTGKNDERLAVYNITLETVKFLGLAKISDLPEYESINTKIQSRTEDSEEIDHG
jgi:segregation and condensation protein B